MSMPRKDGMNWSFVVGGLVATALSLTFGKKKRSTKYVTPESGDGTSMEAEILSVCREFAGSSETSEDCACHTPVALRHCDRGNLIAGAAAKDARLIGNREVLHKLRQQIRSRDEMIMEMQMQMLEKDRTICSQQSLISKLERALSDANESVFAVENVLHDRSDLEVRSSTVICRSKSTSRSPNCGMGIQLQDELLDIRRMACEMASLLEVSEMERLKLRNLVAELGHKLEGEGGAMLCSQSDTRDGHACVEEYILESGSCIPLKYCEYKSSSSDREGSVDRVERYGRNTSEISTSPSSSSASDWLEEEVQESFKFRNDSPGVRIGSPTIEGDGEDFLRHPDNGRDVLRRLLFQATAEEDPIVVSGTDIEAAAAAEKEDPIVVPGTDKETTTAADEEGFSSTDEMLNDTLDHLLKFCSPSCKDIVHVYN